MERRSGKVVSKHAEATATTLKRDWSSGGRRLNCQSSLTWSIQSMVHDHSASAYCGREWHEDSRWRGDAAADFRLHGLDGYAGPGPSRQRTCLRCKKWRSKATLDHTMRKNRMVKERSGALLVPT